jgi:hypothetical protein
MSVRNYTDINIIDECHFNIIETTQKPQVEGAALSTLYRIEKVMRETFKHDCIHYGSTKISQASLLVDLKQRAGLIQDGFLKKSRAIPVLNRFFGRVSRKERTIQAVYKRIENLANPPPVLELPNELIDHIISFLPTTEVNRLAPVNKHGKAYSRQTQIQRAQEYGYKGRNFAEANDYLRTLFQTIRYLAKWNVIPEKYVVYQGTWLFRSVDSEATLRKIKRLNPEDKIALKRNLKPSFIANVRCGRKNFVNALLILGADVNAKDEKGDTVLAIAAFHFNYTEVGLLIQYGADLNARNPRGQTALDIATQRGWNEIVKLLIQAGARYFPIKPSA